jgi:hypothetical protein
MCRKFKSNSNSLDCTDETVKVKTIYEFSTMLTDAHESLGYIGLTTELSCFYLYRPQCQASCGSCFWKYERCLITQIFNGLTVQVHNIYRKLLQLGHLIFRNFCRENFGISGLGKNGISGSRKFRNCNL